MAKAVIIPLNYFLDTGFSKTAEVLVKLGVGKFSIWWHRTELQKTLKTYNRDGNTDKFKRALGRLFPNMKRDETFDNAWKEMVELKEPQRLLFSKIDELIEQGDSVYVFGETNPLHLEYIKQQHYQKGLSGCYYLTCEKNKTLSRLLDEVKSDIQYKPHNTHPTEFKYIYLQPKSMPLGNFGILSFLRWIFAPFQSLDYFHAVEFAAKIKGSFSRNFQMISFKDFLTMSISPLSKSANVGRDDFEQFLTPGYQAQLDCEIANLEQGSSPQVTIGFNPTVKQRKVY